MEYGDWTEKPRSYVDEDKLFTTEEKAKAYLLMCARKWMNSWGWKKNTLRWKGLRLVGTLEGEVIVRKVE
jgi:hypothetical protein